MLSNERDPFDEPDDDDDEDAEEDENDTLEWMWVGERWHSPVPS